MSQYSSKKGIIWSTVERLSVQGVQFILSMILARYLLPSDYGLIAMLNIFLAVSQTFIDSGFGNALIQKQDRTETDYSTVFYFNLTLSILLYIMLFFAAPIIASFYEEPLLKLVLRVSALSLVINSASLIQLTKLRIELDFKTISKASLTSAILSGVTGVFMAVNGYGVWSLVTQTLLSAFLNTLILWFLTKWHPLLVFSKKSFITLFEFGSKLLFSNLLHTIYLNLYTLVIGKFYTSSNVGLYNRASNLSHFTSTNLVGILNRVYYPILCETQNDKVKFRATFIKYVRLATFVVVPLGFGLASIAEPFVEVVLTHRWVDLIWPLKILSWAFVLYPLMSMYCQPLSAAGRSDLYLKAEIVKKVAAIVVMVVAIPFGLMSLCLSVLAYNLLDVVIIMHYLPMVVDTGFKHQIKELYIFFISGIAMELTIEIILHCTTISYLVSLPLCIVVGAGVYLTLMWAFKVPELRFIKNTFV